MTSEQETYNCFRPVPSCSYWQHSECEYCNAVFGPWNLLEKDVFKLPVDNKPGAFIIANAEEILYVGISEKSVKSYLDETLKNISLNKEQTDDECLKIRFTSDLGNKPLDRCLLCAHWLNSGDPPLWQNKWPDWQEDGTRWKVIMTNNNLYFLCKDRKWCRFVVKRN